MEDAHVAVTNLPLPVGPGQGGSSSTPAGEDSSSSNDDDADEFTVASTPVDAKVFGVFDGHGGAEVARFCQLYLVSVLTQQPAWKDGNSSTEDGSSKPSLLPTSPDDPSIPTDPDDLDAAAKTPVGFALRSTFHALDRMIDDPARRYVWCLFVFLLHCRQWAKLVFNGWSTLRRKK